MDSKPDRLFRRSAWPPGAWLPPDVCVYMFSRHGTQFNWHEPTRTHALHYSIHFTKGDTG